MVHRMTRSNPAAGATCPNLPAGETCPTSGREQRGEVLRYHITPNLAASPTCCQQVRPAYLLIIGRPCCSQGSGVVQGSSESGSSSTGAQPLNRIAVRTRTINIRVWLFMMGFAKISLRRRFFGPEPASTHPGRLRRPSYRKSAPRGPCPRNFFPGALSGLCLVPSRHSCRCL